MAQAKKNLIHYNFRGLALCEKDGNVASFLYFDNACRPKFRGSFIHISPSKIDSEFLKKAIIIGDMPRQGKRKLYSHTLNVGSYFGSSHLENECTIYKGLTLHSWQDIEQMTLKIGRADVIEFQSNQCSISVPVVKYQATELHIKSYNPVLFYYLTYDQVENVDCSSEVCIDIPEIINTLAVYRGMSCLRYTYHKHIEWEHITSLEDNPECFIPALACFSDPSLEHVRINGEMSVNMGTCTKPYSFFKAPSTVAPYPWDQYVQTVINKPSVLSIGEYINPFEFGISHMEMIYEIDPHSTRTYSSVATSMLYKRFPELVDFDDICHVRLYPREGNRLFLYEVRISVV